MKRHVVLQEVIIYGRKTKQGKRLGLSGEGLFEAKHKWNDDMDQADIYKSISGRGTITYKGPEAQASPTD